MSGVYDPAQWLRDQLDEDERIARAACEGAKGEWRHVGDEHGAFVIGDHNGGAEVCHDEGYPTLEQATHIAEHDPARVLREIEAKRAIVDAYLPPGEDPHPGEPCINYEGQDPADYDQFDSCWRHVEASKRLLHHDYVLRLLASVYADRPGFREEWRP